MECYIISLMQHSTSKPLLFCLALLGSLAGNQASAIDVTTDIPFLASMISDIVDDGDSVNSIVTVSDSPHSFAFRPSTMRAVQNADLLVLIGEQFMPGVTNAISKLSTDSKLLSLLDLDGIQLYKSEDDHDHHLRAEQAEHAEHAEQAEPIKQVELMDSVDTHIWTDPVNLKIIAAAVRDKLIEIDPARQHTFTLNTDRVIADLAAFDTEQQQRWAAANTVAFVSMHDTTHYFAQRYGLHATDNLFSGEHATPSVKQLRAFQTTIEQSDVRCILTDPNTSAKWTRTLSDLSDVKVASIDALGVTNPDENYLSTLNTLSDTLMSCLTSP